MCGDHVERRSSTPRASLRDRSAMTSFKALELSHRFRHAISSHVLQNNVGGQWVTMKSFHRMELASYSAIEPQSTGMDPTILTILETSACNGVSHRRLRSHSLPSSVRSPGRYTAQRTKISQSNSGSRTWSPSSRCRSTTLEWPLVLRLAHR